MKPRYDFSINSMTKIPNQSVLRNGARHLFKHSVQIFIDGSKVGGTLGDIFFSESIDVAEYIMLPDYCSVFQAEELTIQAAVKIIWNSIRALGSNVMNSRTVYGCRKYLNKLAEV